MDKQVDRQAAAKPPPPPHLKGIDLLVIQHAILVGIAQAEYPAEGLDARQLQAVLPGIIQGGGRVEDGLLGEIKDLAHVEGPLGGALDARFHLLEVRHDGEDGLLEVGIGDVGAAHVNLVAHQHHGHVAAQATDVGEPEGGEVGEGGGLGDGVDDADDVGLFDLLLQDLPVLGSVCVAWVWWVVGG